MDNLQQWIEGRSPSKIVCALPSDAAARAQVQPSVAIGMRDIDIGVGMDQQAALEPAPSSEKGRS